MRGRVVFDGSVLAEPRWTGVATALQHGLRAYTAAADTRPYLLLPESARDPAIDGIDIVPTRTTGVLGRALAMPKLLRRLDAALLHSPVAAMPRSLPMLAGRRAVPVVVTVHDLPWMCEQGFEQRDAGDTWRARAALRYALRHAAVVLCVSRATRNDLLRWHGRSPLARVRVAYNAVPSPAEPAPLTALRGPLLTIGNRRPRKNLTFVHAACARAQAIDARVPALQVLDGTTEWVTEAAKLAHLRSCTALLHLALFEGFGIPIVEAFQNGVPTVCSDRGAMREVAADAAELADPTDLEACARAIVRVCTDPLRRADLRARGLARGATFDPARTAAAWQRVHHRIGRA